MSKKIRLADGVQRRLIEQAKQINGLSWTELGAALEIPGQYLKRDFRYERVLLSESAYKQLCNLASLSLNDSIVEILPQNWGQSKGGKASTPTFKKEKLLVDEHSLELAEIIGILLGDGNSWSKPGFYYIRVCGHSQHDKAYLSHFVKPLFKKVFDVTFREYFHKTNKEMFLTVGNKDLSYTLAHFGFPSGNKIANNVGIPDWVFESEEYLKSCIRGLIDTDGSVCPITGRSYPYIWFSSSIPNLRSSFERAMNILGYDLAKWSKRSNPQTFIAKKALIQKYYKEVGFNNRKHLRYGAPVV